ncbi:hypothetical protein Fmac_002986 [Flemingia macrophylla]|uniref:Uncharacterized protein n=1 Tax=Flemingia macrophylla TaxID=520843 RepID=A0ABD1NLH4_9FABA
MVNLSSSSTQCRLVEDVQLVVTSAHLPQLLAKLQRGEVADALEALGSEAVEDVVLALGGVLVAPSAQCLSFPSPKNPSHLAEAPSTTSSGPPRPSGDLLFGNIGFQQEAAEVEVEAEGQEAVERAVSGEAHQPPIPRHVVGDRQLQLRKPLLRHRPALIPGHCSLPQDDHHIVRHRGCSRAGPTPNLVLRTDMQILVRLMSQGSPCPLRPCHRCRLQLRWLPHCLQQLRRPLPHLDAFIGHCLKTLIDDENPPISFVNVDFQQEAAEVEVEAEGQEAVERAVSGESHRPPIPRHVVGDRQLQLRQPLLRHQPMLLPGHRADVIRRSSLLHQGAACLLRWLLAWQDCSLPQDAHQIVRHRGCSRVGPTPNLVLRIDMQILVRLVSHGSPHPPRPVTAVDFNCDGSLIVSSSYDGLCRI